MMTVPYQVASMVTAMYLRTVSSRELCSQGVNPDEDQHQLVQDILYPLVPLTPCLSNLDLRNQPAFPTK